MFDKRGKTFHIFIYVAAACYTPLLHVCVYLLPQEFERKFTLKRAIKCQLSLKNKTNLTPL